jgi:uncharacterized protein YggU (UPF0235/DUF167 family)
MESEKFNKFLGKMKINVGGEEFEIDPTVEERLPILGYLVANSKASEKGEMADMSLVTKIKQNLVPVFGRNYSDVGIEKLTEFVDKAFEIIISEIALASGWISKEKLLEAANQYTKKKP